MANYIKDAQNRTEEKEMDENSLNPAQKGKKIMKPTTQEKKLKQKKGNSYILSVVATERTKDKNFYIVF